MRSNPFRRMTARLGWLLAFLLPAGALAAPAPPMPPEPPRPPGLKVSPTAFSVPTGETYRGDVFRAAPVVSIEGTVDGDVYVLAQSVRISGVVTGDVFVGAQQIEITGEVKRSLRCGGTNVTIDGTVGGSALVGSTILNLGSKAHVLDNVTAYGMQMMHHGVIDGSLTFTGGTATLGGKVGDDANITADQIEIEPGARIEGDVSYSSRRQMDDQIKAIAGGDVTFDAEAVKERHRTSKDEASLRPTKFGVGKWIFFYIASLLFGAALLALFRDYEEQVSQAIERNALNSAGIGFVSILVTIAVCLSVILILTIPLIVLYLLAYWVAVYLAKIPIAVWLGRKIWGTLGRRTGPFAALAVGLALLYLLFMIPYFGNIVWCAVAMLGLGAMISVWIAQRQTRKAAAAASAASAAPPPEPPPIAAAS